MTDVGYKATMCVFATCRYSEFFPRFITSFLGNTERVSCAPVVRLFSDQCTGNVEIPHLPWPLGTLLRYEYLVQHRRLFADSEYLFLCDVDTEFVGRIGDAIFSDRVVVRGHHHTKFTPDKYPYCRDKRSTAYVAPGEGRYYYIGGFQGGKTETYLADCAGMVELMKKDLANGIIPVNHDESYWNRWLIDHPPTLELDWPWCAGDDDRTDETKLLALKKDHVAYRG